MLTSIQSFVSVSGRISPQFWDVFHKPTTSLCFSLLIFQQLRSILLCKDAFQTHLWQKLAFSSPFCYSNDISSIISFGGIVTLLFSLTISIREDRVLFLLIHLTGVSCFHSSSLILSSFPSFLNWRAVWNPSYPLCHSFNSSGGSVLLISSSNIPSSQVHVLFLPCSTGVLPEFFPSHLVLTGVVSNSILSIKLLIHVFATFKFS